MQKLKDELSQYPWFLGANASDHDEGIYVYVSDHAKARAIIPREYEGLRIKLVLQNPNK